MASIATSVAGHAAPPISRFLRIENLRSDIVSYVSIFFKLILDFYLQAYPSSGSNQGPLTRWGTTRGVTGVSNTAFQPRPPPHTSTASRHTFSMHHQPPPSSSIAPKITPYDRRVVSMVPPPPPPPLHAGVFPNANSIGQESAFTNLLYDVSCNVLPSQTAPQIDLASELSGLSVTPRSVPRTNPHGAGTMPRLPSSRATAKRELPPPPKVPAKMRNGGVSGRNGTSALNAVISSSPDTEITTNSPSASASYSGDSEPEESEPFAKEVLTSANDASIYSVGCGNTALSNDLLKLYFFCDKFLVPVIFSVSI